MNDLPAFLPGVALVLLALAGLTGLAFYYRRGWRLTERWFSIADQRAVTANAILSAAPLGNFVFAGTNNSGDQKAGESGHCSALLAEMLGLPRRESAGDQATKFKDILGFFNGGDARRFDAAAQRLRSDGASFYLTLWRKDGGRVFDITGNRAVTTTGAQAADVIWFQDVTALTRSLDQARSEQNGLISLLDALSVPVWRRDASLELIYCNRAYAQAVDAESDDVLAEGLELLGRTRGPVGQSIARRAVEAGEQVTETHHAVIDGSRRLLAVSERPLPGGTLVGHAIDETAIEDLKAGLARHIEGHADVLENLSTAIAIFGADGRLTFFNSAYTQLWGMDEAFLLTEPHLGDVFENLREARRLQEHANFPEYKKQRVRTLMTLIESLEELQHLPDGTTLRMVASPHPFGGVLLTFEDVTDRLSLERSYNTLIQVQRATLDNLYEGVAVFGGDGRLKLSNPAFARMWGLPAELAESEIHVRDLIAYGRKFYHTDDEVWSDLSEKIVATATQPDTRQGKLERADNTILDWAQVPLPDGASLFTYLDVTDSARVERVLRERNQALETADRLKSEFVANISYELRTPLNAIVGFSEILENQFFGELNERQLEYSRAIVESSQRLTALINDILDIASIEAGYMQLDLAPVDIRSLLQSIETLGHERAHNRNIKLKINYAEDIGSVVADERRLKQALFNLLSNAFKFSLQGGLVTVSAARVGTELQLSVADTGVGIQKDLQGRVFDKFESGGGPAQSSGAGLGLSLVKSLIELHGGRVTLESVPNEGTRVTCHIPLQPDQMAPADDAAESDAQT